MSKGPVAVYASIGQGADGQEPIRGELSFLDNAVDSASGTIRLKASFANPEAKLWPGMYVTLNLTPLVLESVQTLPAQAVQTGPENRFVYVVGADATVSAQPVNVRLIQDGLAVIESGTGKIAADARVVVEGAQNLRPGKRVQEAGNPAPSTGTGTKS